MKIPEEQTCPCTSVSSARVRLLLAALTVCLVSSDAVEAKKGGGGGGPAYNLVTLAPPNVTLTGSYARDLDQSGNVVGYYLNSQGQRCGFYYDLNQNSWLLFGTGIEVTGLNNSGEMVGSDHNTGEGLYWSSASDQNPVTLSPWPGHQTSRAFRINDAGIIIGDSQGDGPPVAVAWAVDDSGVVSAAVELPWPDGDIRGGARNLNEADESGITQIVGASGFDDPYETAVRWTAAVAGGVPALVSGPTDLGSLSGNAPAAAHGVNFRGDIVGQSGVWPFVKPAGEPMQPLAGIRKATNGYAGDINDTGVIVGSQGYLSRGLPIFKAVLWSPAGAVQELNKKVSLGSSDTLEDAFRINNAGHILGSGFFPAITETDNVGFLLVPAT